MREPRNRLFFMPQCRRPNVTHSEGGVRHGSNEQCGEAAFLYLPHSPVVSRFGAARIADDAGRRERRERPPPNRGDLRPKVESRYGVPLLGPMGSLSSSFIPAGRLGKTPLSPRASSFQIGPWTAPGRSEGMTVYEGKGGV